MSAMTLAAGISLLTGCGAVAGAGGGTVGTSTNLSGNWLLAGSLPSIVLPPPPVPTGLTATFDVTGSNVAGILTMQVPCNSGFFAINGSVVSGAIAADGSFTLQTPSTGLGNLVTLKGQVPAAAGGGWSGMYSATIGNCGTATGQIAAVSIPALSGTFAGNAMLGQAGSFTSIPITVKTNLQQGGYETIGGSTLYSNIVLGGTIAITGSPCLTSGTTTGVGVPSDVEGNTVVANFMMNDGSTLEMIGSISSTDSSKLQVSFLTTAAGTCNTLSVAPSTQLVKQ